MAFRLTIATVVASLTSIGAFLLCLLALVSATTRSGSPFTVATVEHTLFFLLLFGWPLTLAVTAAVGVPVVHYLRRRGQELRPAVAVGVAVVIGALFVPLLWTAFWSGSDRPLLWVGIGAIVGVVGGGTFALIMRGGGERRIDPP